MVQTSAQPITLETFLSLPETKPAGEYIDGNIIQKPMPQGKHSTLQLDFSTFINSVARPEKIARAFPELRCTFDGASILPDIAVFTWHGFPQMKMEKLLTYFPLPQTGPSKSYRPVSVQRK